MQRISDLTISLPDSLDRHVLERALRLLIAHGPLSSWESEAASRLLELVKP